MSQYEIETVADFSRFQALAEEWNGLPGAKAYPFLTFEWNLACLLAFHDRAQVYTLTARAADGSLTAVLPMALDAWGPVRRAILLNYPGEPSGFLYTDVEALKDLLALTLKRGLPLKLGRLWPDEAIDEILNGTVTKRATIVNRSGGASPWLKTDMPWAEFEAGLSSKRRNDVKRAFKRAEALGDLAFLFSAPDARTISKVVEDFAVLEASGWKGEQKSSLMHNLDRRAFFESYWGDMARLGRVKVAEMKVDGATAAMFIATDLGGRYWVHKISYHPKFARGSPGIVLMHRALESAFHDGCEYFEFLGQDEQWLRIWTKETRSYSFPRIYPRSAQGIAVFSSDAAHYLAKKSGYRGLLSTLGLTQRR